MLRRTAFGAHVYAVGGNEEASRLAGIKVAWVKFWTYVICGLLTGLAGMVLMARLSSAQPAVGEGVELYAIAAVVLGGTSLMGGRGSGEKIQTATTYELEIKLGVVQNEQKYLYKFGTSMAQGKAKIRLISR